MKIYDIVTKTLLITGIIVMLAIAAFALRMQAGPIDLNFAKARVEAALSNPEQGYKVEIGKLDLTWPAVIKPISLDLKNVRILQQEQTGLSVNQVQLGISGKYLFLGRILPSWIIIEQPTFQILQENGKLNLFWQNQDKAQNGSRSKTQAEENIVENPSMDTMSSINNFGYQIGHFLEQITNPKTSNSVFSALKRFELKQAVLTAKETDNNHSYLALADVSLRKGNNGLQGDLFINLPAAQGENKSFIQSDVIYLRDKKDLVFTAQVTSVSTDQFSAFIPEKYFFSDQNIKLNGNVKTVFNEGMNLELASLDMTIPEGEVKLPEGYKTLPPVKDIQLQAEYNRPEKRFDVTNLSVDMGGIILKGKTAAKFQEGDLQAPLELTVDDLPLEKLHAAFPEDYAETTLGKWATKRLKGGRFYDVKVTTNLKALRYPAQGEERFSLDDPKVTFKAEGVTVTYSNTLTPVSQVVGSGEYFQDTFQMIDSKGFLGEIEGSSINLKISDLSTKGGGLADINFDAKGSLKSVLDYISKKPISLSDNLGFDVNNVRGQADLNVQLNFPTTKELPKEDVNVAIKGKVKDIVLPDVVQGLSLTGGPYDFGFSEGAITIKGKGQISERPITLDWKQYIHPEEKEYETKITAQVTADRELCEAFDVGFSDYISGPLPINITYIDKGDKSTIDIKGDLTPSTIHIDSFAYHKKEAVVGDFSMKAYLEKGDIKEVNDMHLQAKDLSFSNGRILFKQLKDGSSGISRGSIPDLNIGKTKVKADFEVTPDDVVKVIIIGTVVDIAPFLKSNKESTNWNNPKESAKKAQKISIVADKMLCERGEEIGKTKIYFETDTQGDVTRIEMDSKIGQGDMYLRFKPDVETGKRTFRLESSDAGQALRVFGINDKIRGGSMVIYGEPQTGDNQGNLFGKAQINDFRVKKAPALAKLLGAMSLGGAQDLLSNEGIKFKRLESDFEWRFRNKGNLLVIKDGRTSGSSLGLTFKGVLNEGDGTIDLSGTIIPLSGVNKMLGGIPVIGDILTAGDALIAATYNVKGPTDDPNVAVNPLSVLAPGFLRKILFEGSVERKVKKEEAK